MPTTLININEKWEYKVDDIVDKLARPIFILRMSRPFELENTTRGRACRKKARNARQEIVDLIEEVTIK